MVENNCTDCGVPIPKGEWHCPPCERRWQGRLIEEKRAKELNEMLEPLRWLALAFVFIVMPIVAILVTTGLWKP